MILTVNHSAFLSPTDCLSNASGRRGVSASETPLDSAIAATHDRRFELAEVYQLTSSNSTPIRGSDIEISLVNAFHYTMPAMSVSTLVLVSGEYQSDFDLDGDVDGDDFLIWQNGFGAGTTRAEGDANRDGNVDGDDFLIWQTEFGSVSGNTTAVPEPASVTLWAVPAAAWLMLRGRRRR